MLRHPPGDAIAHGHAHVALELARHAACGDDAQGLARLVEEHDEALVGTRHVGRNLDEVLEEFLPVGHGGDVPARVHHEEQLGLLEGELLTPVVRLNAILHPLAQEGACPLPGILENGDPPRMGDPGRSLGETGLAFLAALEEGTHLVEGDELPLHDEGEGAEGKALGAAVQSAFRTGSPSRSEAALGAAAEQPRPGTADGTGSNEVLELDPLEEDAAEAEARLGEFEDLALIAPGEDPVEIRRRRARHDRRRSPPPA